VTKKKNRKWLAELFLGSQVTNFGMDSSIPDPTGQARVDPDTIGG